MINPILINNSYPTSRHVPFGIQIMIFFNGTFHWVQVGSVLLGYVIQPTKLKQVINNHSTVQGLN